MPAYNENDLNTMARLLPGISEQLRAAMASVSLSAARIAPPEEREKNPALDRDTALLNASCYRMLRLINNLSAAELLANPPHWQFYSEDAVSLCQEACDKAEALFELCGLTVSFTSDTAFRPIAMERTQMERLLFNLFSNAMKFTPAGGKVTVSLRETRDWVHIAVSDTGCGIPADKQDALFERAFLDDPLDPTPHGIGLGLPLCAMIARAHGGRIVAESHEGKGTTVTVSLPNRNTDSVQLHQPTIDYAGGFNRVLLELSDALPAEAFLQKNLD